MEAVQRSALVVLALAAAAAGCVGAVRRDVEVDGDRREDRTESAEVQVHLDRDAGRIARGRDAAARGDFAAALAQFDAVARDPAAADDKRAQALYQMALVHSNALNPQRDPAQAASAARRVVVEFPETEWRDEAEALLRTLEAASP